MFYQTNSPGNIKDKVALPAIPRSGTSQLWDSKSLFWSPDYLEVSAWVEHIPFAFWLTEMLQPKIIVELGVHLGTSYFAFCQAVDRLSLATSVYGVDTWVGDQHAGFYGEEVFNQVAGYNSSRYSKFSTLIRSSFDDAKNYFIDGSIDLLHIDGAHTYEAVRKDFTSWLPKLSARGVVIFHDINVRERNFGVFRLWDELKKEHKHFQFDFGFGLGILAPGETDSEEINRLFNAEYSGYQLFLNNLFFERGSFFKTKSEMLKALNLANQNIESEKKEHLVLAKKYGEIVLANEKLVEENDRLTAEYKQLMLSSDTSLKTLSRQLEKEKTTNDHIQSEILRQKQLLEWYKETYEKRSFLGVIKEKLKKKIVINKADAIRTLETSIGQGKNIKGFRKYNGFSGRKAARNTFYLNPSKQLIEQPELNAYSSIGDDPFFLVDYRKKYLKAGWYWLSIDISELSGMLLSPRIYYDYGRGFNEEDTWKLPKIVNGRIETLIRFSENVSGLRFDPTTADCTFIIRKFHLKPVGKLQAFLVAMARYKKSFYPHQSSLLFYSSLVNTWLRNGKSALRNKFWDAVLLRPENSLSEYNTWCSLYDTLTSAQYEQVQKLADGLEYQPLFSIIVPVYNPPLFLLRKAIDSVRNQAYSHWELCIADDKSTNDAVHKLLKEYEAIDSRIKIVFRKTNGHISAASNSALSLATGDYVVLLDQDDELPAHSLYMVARAINSDRNLGIIYSDEDKIDEKGNRFDPYFKTDWNRDLFYGQNMINHLGVYKHSLIKKIGGFRVGFEGSQDYDLALRCIEHLKPAQIYHIPHILYHWRATKGSTAVDGKNKAYAVEAGLKALQDHFKRTRQQATPLQNVNNSYRTQWSLPEQQPLVSIIIPTKDKVEILSTCVSSILEKTSYRNFEVLIVDNESETSTTFDYFETIQQEQQQVRVHSYKGKFNFSAIVNYGVEQAKGEVLVLLNNDTSVINSDWLCEMVSLCLREEIGAVGAKLFYPNGQIQHAGVFLYEGHPGNHIYLKREGDDPGYFNKLNLVQEYSAVTAACLAVRKQVYLEAGGFDEENLKVAYNDVDFCLKLRQLGYRNLWTPFAQLFHYESLSRGSDLDQANLFRFKSEQSFMLAKWENEMLHDPFFNPNLAIETHSTEFAFPPKVKYEWQKEAVVNQKKKYAEA